MSTASNSVMRVTSYPKAGCTNTDHLATKSLRQARIIEIANSTPKERDILKRIKLAALLLVGLCVVCLLYTSPSPRDLSTYRMPSSA